MKKESLNDELLKLAPLLREAKQTGDGFRLPEGYFEVLEDSVFSRIEAMGARRQLVLRAKRGTALGWFFRPQAAVAVAATLTLVLAAVWFFSSDPVPATTVGLANTQELSEEDIEAYVLENIRDFDADQLATYSSVADVAPIKAESSNPPENKTKNGLPLDGLSEEELEMLLKEMSEEELKSLL